MNKEDAKLAKLAKKIRAAEGDIKAAIKWQRDALEKAGESSMARELRETLIRYEKFAASRL